MAKNIEMSVLGSDGSYEVLYPYTIPSQVEDLLNNDTKVYIGLSEDSTPDDAFRSLYLLNVLQGKIALTLTVKDSATGTPMEGVQIACSSYCDAKGNPIAGPIETNSEGKIDVFCSVSNPTLSISGYFDIEDYSQQFTYELGNSYSAEWNVTTRNFLKMTSSTNKMFSLNVNSVDVCCVGGGGGSFSERSSRNKIFGGGGGGYCVVQESVNFVPNTKYSCIVGSGGTSSDGDGVDYDNYYKYAGVGGNSSLLSVVAEGGSAGCGVYSNIENGGTFPAVGNGNGGYYKYFDYDNVRGEVNPTEGNSIGYYSFTETGLYGGGGMGGYTSAGTSSWGYTDGTTYGGGRGNTGRNGFGGGGGFYYNDSLSGSRGGSGCVAIRMHLKTAI